jgi:subtilisin family serine protease
MRKKNVRVLAVGLALLAACSRNEQPPLESTSSPLSQKGADNSAAARAAQGRYIVVFKRGVAKKGVTGQGAGDVAAALNRKHGGSIDHTYQHALNGAAMRLTPEAAAALRADSRVAYVEPDGVVTINDTQTSATWGLDRADQRQLPLNQTYDYPTNAGEGVHAYVIDTGIYGAHTEFAKSDGTSRVIPGYDFVDNDSDPTDCNGHGTHVSGTIGGTTYGLAKKVTLHSVRVLDCGGSGTYAGVIAGIDWVTANHQSPAVANMSLGGGFSQAVNDAVTASVASGVTYAIAAGNSSADACSYSPASTPNAITVGATNSSDARSSFSNYGKCVDIFAPGESITSSWIGGTTATNTISGTSMASPHVAGSAVLWLGLHPTATPADVSSALLMRGSPNLVSNPGTGSPNVLLYAGNMTGGTTNPPVASVSIQPATLEGGGPTSVTVLLSDVAPAAGAVVALASGNPAVVSVPASVTVPAGAQGAVFSVTPAKTTAETAVTITATYPASTSVTGTMNVLPSPTPQSVTLSPTSVVGGQTSTATITLSGAAPAGGALVSLASSNTAVATVPANVTIAEGATTGTFTITTLAQASSTSATISAAYHGLTRTAPLTVTMTPGVSSVYVSPAILMGGGNATGTVYLNTSAPTGGLVVTLASNNGAATVPASVTVSAGYSSATFTINTTTVTAQTAVTISATNGATRTATLTVVPSPTPSAVSLSPSSVVGGNPSTATLTLTGPAPAGGSVVTLASSNTSVATVPSTLTIPEGASSGTFTVTTTTQSTSYSVSISASLNGLSASSYLSVMPIPYINTLSVSPSTIQGGKNSTGTVYLTTSAPTGGTIVTLSSNNGAVTVPTSVTVPAGTSSATFAITSTTVSTATTVTISASCPASTTRTASLTLVPSPTPSTITLSPSSVAGGQTSTATVVLTEAAPAAGSVLTLLSSNTTAATVPSTLTIPAGATSGTFTVNTVASSVTQTATISAALNGLSVSVILTVTRVVVPGNATYDATLMVPRCATVGSYCDTGGIIDGRANLGPETNAPNSLKGTCADGTSGTYHNDESLDRLKVSTTDNTPLAAGKTVLIEATVWSYNTSDYLDLYFAPDANNPSWTFITTKQATGSQKVEVLSTTFTLPTATLPVIRGQWRYTGSASSCSTGSYNDRDDVVFALDGASNTAPVVNAGTDQTITLPATANLTGTATDDGLPNPPATLTTTWSMVSGPGTVTFTNANALTTTAAFSAAGTYTLRLTASDSALSTSDDVVITVNPSPTNTAPVVNAGADQTVVLPATATLSGTATDDGLPNPPAALTTTWSMVSGPGTVTFAHDGALNTTASFSAAGTYTLRLTASDSVLSTTDDVVITVNPTPVNTAPVVNAGTDQTITLPATASLSGTATDDGLPNPPAALTTTWSTVSGPGTVTFANANALVTTASFSAAGTYTLRLTATDSTLSTTDDVVVTANPAVTNTAPVVNAGADQTITLPATATLVGTATDDGLPNPPAALTVTWSTVSGPGTVTFADANALSTTATFSAAGTYTLRLTASDSALSTGDNVVVTVNGGASNPCAGLCNNPVVFSISGSYQSGNLGTGAICYETTANIYGGNCGNFVSPRTLSVNGTVQSCSGGNWSSVPAKRNGGYCIQTTAGNYSWAYFTAW